MLAVLQQPRNVLVLGGMTGSGKTVILKELGKAGAQVIDLEGLACHKGSAFGALGQEPQPSNEQFENLLAEQWMRLDPSKPCFLENESHSIGRIKIPDTVFAQMRTAPVVEVICSMESRMRRILEEYGTFDKALLAEGTERISKRLGGQHVKAALQALEEDRMRDWLEILLVYYDKNYQHGNSKRSAESIHPVTWNDDEPIETYAARIIRLQDELAR